MPQYRYKARTGQGELVTGLLQAASTFDAGGILRGEGKFPIMLDEVAASSPAKAGKTSDASSRGGRGGRIKHDHVISFAHQLAVMVDTGVPLSEALDCAAQQCDNDRFRAVLEDVAEKVQGGEPLSVALGNQSKVFPSVMISLVAASELSGTMGRMLDRVSSYLSQEAATARKIKGAMTYPCILMVMITLVTISLLVWVLPRFTEIFEGKGAALPLPTQMLIFASDQLIQYWYAYTGGTFAAVFAMVFAARTPRGRRVLDAIKLSSPVLGDLFCKLYLTRATRTMGTMVDAGVPILDMLATTRQVTRNVYFEDLWDDLSKRLERGGQLSDGLFESPLFPRSITQMIFAGEKSGRLGKTLNRIAEFTEEEFDQQIKSTTQLIEPALTAAMGIIIGFIAIALLLPIFSVSQVVSS
jgi:type IV pilus assembly protein PilC